MKVLYKTLMGIAAAVTLAQPGWADWQAANSDVTAAAQDARIAGALNAVNAIDHAAMSNDHAAFVALLADDLAVNNPQNAVSVRGATARRNADGKISYARYDRIVEYAGLRNGLVLIMGEEIVEPREDGHASTGAVHRRFTDLWKQIGDGWRLTARQATVVTRP